MTAYLDWMAGGKNNTGTARVASLAGPTVRAPELRVVCADMCVR